MVPGQDFLVKGFDNFSDGGDAAIFIKKRN
jgi:hypothetical protein